MKVRIFAKKLLRSAVAPQELYQEFKKVGQFARLDPLACTGYSEKQCNPHRRRVEQFRLLGSKTKKNLRISVNITVAHIGAVVKPLFIRYTDIFYDDYRTDSP